MGKGLNREFLGDQLIKLGDMIGDGLHYEDPSIEKEYSKIARLLYPEMYKKKREATTKVIDIQMRALLTIKKCVCGGTFKQSRSGSKVAYCLSCQKRVIAQAKKK